MIAANQAVYQLGQGQSQERMGSTVAAAVIRGNELIVGNVGDSRVYLLRGGGIQQLSQDHTWVAERVAAGDLAEAEARAHPQRNILLRSLGAKPEVQPFVAQPLQLAQGDRVLLCSDGLWEPVDDATIAQIVNGHGPGAAARMLVNAANARGGHDNITALVIPVGTDGALDSVIDSARANPALIGLVGAAGLAFAVLFCIVAASFWRQVSGQVQALPTATAIVLATTKTVPAPMKTPSSPSPTQATGTPVPEDKPSPTPSSPESPVQYCVVVLERYPYSPVYAFHDSQDSFTNIVIEAGKILDDAFPTQLVSKWDITTRRYVTMVKIKYSDEDLWILRDRLGTLNTEQKCIRLP
jgi:hypothetical protein